MKKIYIFSGLGADERVFGNLDLDGYDPVFMKWIQPLPGEGIEAYAKRLSAGIVPEKPVLLGLSFGGMMAVEVAKHISTERVILISSAKSRDELPYYYRLAGRMRLHKLLPSVLLKQAGPLAYWLFGAESKEEKLLLRTILRETDTAFLRWAIHQALTWKNRQPIANLTHIHGTSDRLLPYRFVKAHGKVRGGHFMVLNRSRELGAYTSADA
ncbi:MAG: alpha/beta hydrolase [Bacteroidota bacterium]